MQKEIDAAMILSRPQPDADDEVRRRVLREPRTGRAGAARRRAAARRRSGEPPGSPGAAGPEGSGETGGDAVRALDRPGQAPSETALKALMFPSTTAAAVTDQEFRFVSRVAFPTLIPPNSLANTVVISLLDRALRMPPPQPRRAAGRLKPSPTPRHPPGPRIGRGGTGQIRASPMRHRLGLGKALRVEIHHDEVTQVRRMVVYW